MDRNSFEITCSCIAELDRGGGRQGEKGAGGVRQAGEDGARSGIPKLAGSGRKNAKRREPTSTGREPGLKGTESGSFKPPCPSPPPPHVLAEEKKQFAAPLDTICIIRPV